MKKKGVKRIGCCENGAAKDGIVIIIVDEALVDLYPHTSEILPKPDHPNALKEERGVKAKNPLQNIFRYQHDG
jgi:hypothetical protein